MLMERFTYEIKVFQFPDEARYCRITVSEINGPREKVFRIAGQQSVMQLARAMDSITDAQCEDYFPKIHKSKKDKP